MMSKNRIYQSIMTSLAADKSAAELEMERLINSGEIETIEKVELIKTQLEIIANINNTTQLWNVYMGEDEVGDNNETNTN